MICSRCGKSLYSEVNNDLFWFRDIVFKSPMVNWCISGDHPEVIEALKPYTKERIYRLCIGCSIEFGEVLDNFLEEGNNGRSDDQCDC